MMDYVDVLHLINRVLEAVPLLPVAILWSRRIYVFKKHRFLVYYANSEMLYYIIDVISRYIFKNNVYIFHLSTVTTILLLSYVYYGIIRSKNIQRGLRIGTYIFVTVALADAVFLNGLFVDLNSYAQAVGSLLLVAIALLHIMQVSRTSLDLTSQPEFILSVSILIYFSYTITTYVASNVIYNSGYDVETRIKLDRIVSAPDAFLYAVHMGLLAWMFSFFPSTTNPLRALPNWLHYSRWHQRPYKVLGQSAVVLPHLTAA